MKIVFCIIIIFSSFQYSRAQANPKTWFWKITKAGINKTSYIFGTFHEIGNHYFDSLVLTRSGLLKSDIIFVESLTPNRKENPGSQKATPVAESDESIKRAYVAGGNYWRELLTPAQLTAFRDYVLKMNVAYYFLEHAGPLYVKLNRMYIMNFCSNARLKSDTAFMMDDQIIAMAKKNKKQLVGLDDAIKDLLNQNSSNATADVSDSVWAGGVVYFMDLILNRKLNREPCKDLDDYLNYRIPYSFNKDRNHNIMNISLRNMKWKESIIKSLPTRSCFIAVGLQHIQYKDGLIQQLRNLGYQVTPLKSTEMGETKFRTVH